MALIAEFLRSEAGKPFAWGDTDCASTVDRWARSILGVSPLGLNGRQYRNEAEANAWLAEPGGIAVAVNRVLRNAGLKKTRHPKAGDIGLMRYDRRLCMAMFTGELWIARTEAGFVASRKCWKAWAL